MSLLVHSGMSLPLPLLGTSALVVVLLTLTVAALAVLLWQGRLTVQWKGLAGHRCLEPLPPAPQQGAEANPAAAPDSKPQHHRSAVHVGAPQHVAAQHTQSARKPKLRLPVAKQHAEDEAGTRPQHQPLHLADSVSSMHHTRPFTSELRLESSSHLPDPWQPDTQAPTPAASPPRSPQKAQPLKIPGPVPLPSVPLPTSKQPALDTASPHPPPLQQPHKTAPGAVAVRKPMGAATLAIASAASAVKKQSKSIANLGSSLLATIKEKSSTVKVRPMPTLFGLVHPKLAKRGISPASPYLTASEASEPWPAQAQGPLDLAAMGFRRHSATYRPSWQRAPEAEVEEEPVAGCRAGSESAAGPGVGVGTAAGEAALQPKPLAPRPNAHEGMVVGMYIPLLAQERNSSPLAAGRVGHAAVATIASRQQAAAASLTPLQVGSPGGLGRVQPRGSEAGPLCFRHGCSSPGTAPTPTAASLHAAMYPGTLLGPLPSAHSPHGLSWEEWRGLEQGQGALYLSPRAHSSTDVCDPGRPHASDRLGSHDQEVTLFLSPGPQRFVGSSARFPYAPVQSPQHQCSSLTQDSLHSEPSECSSYDTAASGACRALPGVQLSKNTSHPRSGASTPSSAAISAQLQSPPGHKNASRQGQPRAARSSQNITTALTSHEVSPSLWQGASPAASGPRPPLPPHPYASPALPTATGVWMPPPTSPTRTATASTLSYIPSYGPFDMSAPAPATSSTVPPKAPAPFSKSAERPAADAPHARARPSVDSGSDLDLTLPGDLQELEEWERQHTGTGKQPVASGPAVLELAGRLAFNLPPHRTSAFEELSQQLWGLAAQPHDNSITIATAAAAVGAWADSGNAASPHSPFRSEAWSGAGAGISPGNGAIASPDTGREVSSEQQLQRNGLLTSALNSLLHDPQPTPLPPQQLSLQQLQALLPSSILGSVPSHTALEPLLGQPGHSGTSFSLADPWEAQLGQGDGTASSSGPAQGMGGASADQMQWEAQNLGAKYTALAALMSGPQQQEQALRYLTLLNAVSGMQGGTWQGGGQPSATSPGQFPRPPFNAFGTPQQHPGWLSPSALLAQPGQGAPTATSPMQRPADGHKAVIGKLGPPGLELLRGPLPPDNYLFVQDHYGQLYLVNRASMGHGLPQGSQMVTLPPGMLFLPQGTIMQVGGAQYPPKPLILGSTTQPGRSSAQKYQTSLTRAVVSVKHDGALS